MYSNVGCTRSLGCCGFLTCLFTVSILHPRPIGSTFRFGLIPCICNAMGSKTTLLILALLLPCHGLITDENEARTWLDSWNTEASRIYPSYWESSWRYQTNMTDHNQQLGVRESMIDWPTIIVSIRVIGWGCMTLVKVLSYNDFTWVYIWNTGNSNVCSSAVQSNWGCGWHWKP